MTDRFEYVYEIPGSIYEEGAPVIIAGGRLLKDKESANMIVQMKMYNLSSQKIVAAKVKLNTKDVMGKIVDKDIEYQYLDLSASSGKEFGANKAIIVPSNIVRSFEISELAIIFETGEKWICENDMELLNNPEAITTKLKTSEVIKQYKMETTKFAQFVPAEVKDLWNCTCGFWNKGNVCTKCGTSKKAVFGSLDVKELAQRAQNRCQKEEQERKENIYQSAKKLYSSSSVTDIKESKRLFESIDNWKDSEEYRCECDKKISSLVYEANKRKKIAIIVISVISVVALIGIGVPIATNYMKKQQELQKLEEQERAENIKKYIVEEIADYDLEEAYELWQQVDPNIDKEYIRTIADTVKDALENGFDLEHLSVIEECDLYDELLEYIKFNK